MTQIIGPKSCLHNLINLQFPHNRSHCAVPRSYCVSPHARPCRRITARHSKMLAFLPFSPQITTKPAWCLLLGHKRALAPVISKQAQTGGKKADSLSCTICHMAAKPNWYGWSLGHSQGHFFYQFYFLLPCMCLYLGRKCETKSLSGPHHAGFTVLAQPVQGAALIVICAIFQTVLTIGLWKPLIAKIALHSSCGICCVAETPRKQHLKC